MLSYDEIEELGERRVCWDCVGDGYLKALIKKSGKTAKCAYCGKRRKSFALSEIGQLAMDGVDTHYEIVSESAGENLEFVVAEEAEVDETLAKDLATWIREETDDFETAKIGEPQRFDEEHYYRTKKASGWELQEAWKEFEKSFKHRARFFSRAAEAMFESIFAQLSELRAAEGAPVIVDAGPKEKLSVLYRGRVFFSEEATHEALKYPHKYLGPPPARLAIVGRMNPQGISVFYGATSLETVLSETRPPVGSNVVVGAFNIVRPLRLLDVSAFRKVLTEGSIFDPDYRGRQERAAFLNRLAYRISRPVMPGDEPLDYLTTQAMAEYFAEVHDPPLDGLIYGSAQAGLKASNVVLFHRSSKVEEPEILEGLIMEVTRDYGHPEDNDPSATYIIWEKHPQQKSEKMPDMDDSFGLDKLFGAAAKELPERPVTLQLKLDSVVVCSIDPSDPNFVEHEVKRYKEPDGSPF